MPAKERFQPTKRQGPQKLQPTEYYRALKEAYQNGRLENYPGIQGFLRSYKLDLPYGTNRKDLPPADPIAYRRHQLDLDQLRETSIARLGDPQLALLPRSPGYRSSRRWFGF